MIDAHQSAERRRLETLARDELARLQLERLNELLRRAAAENRFYQPKLAGLNLPLGSLDELARIPFTLKGELLPTGRESVVANHHTWPPDRYTRWHQTSGSRGRPLVILDTPDDWQWWIHCWQFVLDSADVTAADRVLMAFSFGPFIGFWCAHEAAARRGCLVIPAGGMKTLARLELLRSSQATVVCCTPSYALHLAQTAAERNFDLAGLPVRTLIVAGEPGGSAPAFRQRIENAWDARVVDHCGATEIGAWGYADPQRRGLLIIESEFIAEFIKLDSGKPAQEGELAELVLTSLGRFGCPLIRYRTGDLVRPVWNHGGAAGFVLLDGGVLGRADDMFIVRGVNVFPGAVEQILRSFPEVEEYRLTVRQAGAMQELSVEVEDRLDQPRRIAEELHVRLGLRVDVSCVPLGSLPRFEGKGNRLRRV